MRCSSWFLVGVLLVLGCARSLPPDRSAAALYRDMQRLVGLAAAAGWDIDRSEVSELQEPTLLSLCQVEPDQRQALLVWLDEQIVGLGGPVEVAYAQRGKRLGAVEELLEATRIRMTLARAMDTAARDCPFWLEPRASFSGRQVSDDAWLLHFGSGGKGIFVSQGGREDLYFGGASRLLIGRTIGDRWGFFTGFEGGASASFPKDDNGERSNLVLGVDMVVPVVARYRLVNSYAEVEVGYLGRFTEEDHTVIPGIHLGVSFGGRASRRRWFFPGAVFGVSYERTLPSENKGLSLQSVKLGFRVAIDIGL